MTQTRILDIRFKFPLPFALIPAFRGAIASESGFENVLFHNHLDTGYRYGYPLIQYKHIGGRPVLICINEGVDEVYEFFRKRKRSLRLNGISYPVDIGDISLKTWCIGQNNFRHKYHISNWMALNQANYQLYKNLRSDEERMELLESILIGNVKSMGKGMGIWFDRNTELRLERMPEVKNGKFKNRSVMLFNAEFTTNVSIPNFLGLGKGVSIGFGMLYHLSKEKEKEENIKAILKG